MKISKRTIATLSCGMSLILIGSGAFAGLSLIKENYSDDTKEDKPLNRGDNYEHFKISQYIQKNDELTSLISTYIENNKYKKKINESKFDKSISKIIKDTLSNISKFKSSINKYKFDMSYRIESNGTTALVDIVWYIPTNCNQYYYYDQFRIDINNS